MNRESVKQSPVKPVAAPSSAVETSPESEDPDNIMDKSGDRATFEQAKAAERT